MLGLERGALARELTDLRRPVSAAIPRRFAELTGCGTAPALDATTRGEGAGVHDARVELRRSGKRFQPRRLCADTRAVQPQAQHKQTQGRAAGIAVAAGERLMTATPDQVSVPSYCTGTLIGRSRSGRHATSDLQFRLGWAGESAWPALPHRGAADHLPAPPRRWHPALRPRHREAVVGRGDKVC